VSSLVIVVDGLYFCVHDGGHAADAACGDAVGGGVGDAAPRWHGGGAGRPVPGAPDGNRAVAEHGPGPRQDGAPEGCCALPLQQRCEYANAPLTE
jgi:hypothetical protein